MKKWNDFWTIRIYGAELQWHTFALQSKDDCFISANTKLVSVDKAVLLSTRDLADAFSEAVLPTLRRRHGDEVQAVVASCSTTRKEVDDLLVRARIDDRLFAPNKRPSGFQLAK